MSIQKQFEELYKKELKSYFELNDITDAVNKEQIKLNLYKDLLKKVLDDMFKNDSRIKIESSYSCKRYFVIRLYYINGLRDGTYTEVLKIEYVIEHLNNFLETKLETNKTMVCYKTYNTQQDFIGNAFFVNASTSGQKVMKLDLDKIPKIVEESINRVNRVIKKYKKRIKRYKIMRICREKEILK